MFIASQRIKKKEKKRRKCQRNKCNYGNTKSPNITLATLTEISNCSKEAWYLECRVDTIWLRSSVRVLQHIHQNSVPETNTSIRSSFSLRYNCEFCKWGTTAKFVSNSCKRFMYSYPFMSSLFQWLPAYALQKILMYKLCFINNVFISSFFSQERLCALCKAGTLVSYKLAFPFYAFYFFDYIV